MEEILQFLLDHGYAILFFFVLAEQLGLPLPAIPVLAAMGALIRNEEFSFWTALIVAASAALTSDLVWYGLGRNRGHSILHWICRISLEPDSCVRRTENTFARHGARALLIAKFVPGLNTAAPPLAGMFGMNVWKFLACDGLGAILWIGTFFGLGYLFSAELEQLATFLEGLGTWAIVLLVGGLVAYIVLKYLQRQRFIRQLRVARIAPEELRKKLESGERLLIVDLRHDLEWDAEARKIPGALQLHPDELDTRHTEIPRDLDVILYCT